MPLITLGLRCPFHSQEYFCPCPKVRTLGTGLDLGIRRWWVQVSAPLFPSLEPYLGLEQVDKSSPRMRVPFASEEWLLRLYVDEEKSKEKNGMINYINFRQTNLPTCQKHGVE